MRVTVTGALGLLGSAVAKELSAAGHVVCGVDQHHPSRKVVDACATWEVINLLDPCAARASLRDSEVVVHLAAIPDLRTAPGEVVLRDNVVTAYNIAMAAGEIGVPRLIYASSQCATGLPYSPILQSPAYLPVDEVYPCRPLDPYGMSKYLGEAICEAMCRVRDTAVWSLRFPVIWPPEEFSIRIRRRIDDELQAAKSLWAYVDIRDAARAIRNAAERQPVGFQIVNVTARDAFISKSTGDAVRDWFGDIAYHRSLGIGESLFEWRNAATLLNFKSMYRWTRDGIVASIGDDS